MKFYCAFIVRKVTIHFLKMQKQFIGPDFLLTEKYGDSNEEVIPQKFQKKRDKKCSVNEFVE